MNNLIPEFEGITDIYIYGCGIVGRWLASLGDPRLRGFVETDIKKKGQVFHGLKVFQYDEQRRFFTDGTLILVSVADIADIVPHLKRQPDLRWIPLGPLLESVVVKGNTIGESDEFVQYAAETVHSCHKAFLDPARVFIRSVDLMITEKCSLKCKDCANLMQYYESAKDIALDEVIRDFDGLAQSSDDIHEIRLIGGEPFMNKSVYRIIEHICASPKVRRLVIYTNATIPLKENEVPVLRHPKVVFSLTDYGDLSKNTQKVVDFLDHYDIPYRLHLPENWTDSGAIIDNGLSEDQLKPFFTDCCGKNLYTVTDGRLYRCPFAANADRLKAVPEDPRNGVLLTASAAEIRHYLYDIEFLPACRYCKGRSFSAPEIVPAIQTKKALPYHKYIPMSESP